MTPENRPLGLAKAGHGWFVFTDPLDGTERDMIPEELWAAISFARAQGCRCLFLDRDADTVEHLETFDWLGAHVRAIQPCRGSQPGARLALRTIVTEHAG